MSDELIEMQRLAHKELCEREGDNKCDYCKGDGWTTEHDSPSRHGEDGECISCPIQAGCEKCKGTGNASVEKEVEEEVTEPWADRPEYDDNGEPNQ